MALESLKTPFKLGFRMPAEWERHESTWLSWPKDPTTFPPEILGRVESIYAEMIHEIALGERVNVLVNSEGNERRALSLIGREENVVFSRIASVDVWIRDYGPIFVKKRKEEEGSVAITKWIFNAWGNKYEDLLRDNETGLSVARSTKLQMFEPSMVLEGGSIDVNGLGSLITTEQCLLNRNRNPCRTKNEIIENLREYLGATNVIWLKSGIAGDDTDGHVDDIARFVSRDRIVCMIADDPGDENYEALKRNYEILLNAKDQDERSLTVVPISMPKRKIESAEGRLPASYANFYIANSAVLVPTYNDPNDERALEIIQECFPNRKVVGIECEALVFGFGSIHCVTQQQPA